MRGILHHNEELSSLLLKIFKSHSLSDVLSFPVQTKMLGEFSLLTTREFMKLRL